jgi:ATP-binding cassette subfamily B protein
MKDKLTLLWELLRGHRRHYLAAAAAVWLATFFSYLAPLVLRFTIDTVLGEQPFSLAGRPLLSAGEAIQLQGRLWLCGLALLVCAALQGYFSYARARWASVASEGLACNLRNRLYDHLNRLPFQAQSNLETGDVIQRCTSDVETVRLFVESQTVEIARILMMLGTAIPIMAMLDKRMTLVSTVLMPLVIGGSGYYFFRVRRLFTDSTEAEARLSTILQENLTGVRLVKAFSRSEFEIGRFALSNEDYRDKTYRMMRAISFYWGGSAFFCMLQIALVLIVGTQRAVAGTLSIGTFAVFLTYVSLMVWPIRMLGHVLSEAGRATVSLGRLLKILNQPQESATPAESLRPEIRGQIEFRNVSFTYGGDAPALHQISFSVEPGQTVAIVGRTGSGKSTLVHLLPRLLEYSSGSIRIDDCELRRIDRAWIRSKIGIALQEPFLFSKSLRDNISLGARRQSENDVEEAAHIADLHTTIVNSFKEGYDTMVGERGVTLSGGQRQRVAIARAILSQPPILIFDDSLSAVDAETDLRIRQALSARHGQSTTFIISHRISTVSQADLILVLEEGRLTACGTHEELASQEGLYQRICRIQNLLEEDLRQDLEDHS